MTTTHVGTAVEMLHIRFDTPREIHFEDLHSLLISMRDLVAVSLEYDGTEEQRRGMPELIVDARRKEADDNTVILTVSYGSPLEILLALSSGAGFILLLASRAAKAIKDLAESRVEVARAQTMVMEERNKQVALEIIRIELEKLQIVYRDPKALPPHGGSRFDELFDNAAKALIKIESIEQVD